MVMKLKNILNFRQYIIPAIIIACVVLAIVFSGMTALSGVFKVIGTLLGGLMVGGFYTVVLSDQEDARLLGSGTGILIVVTLVLWFLLGTGWLMFFLPYTGAMTALLLFLEARRKATQPKDTLKK
jgi:hypothetical protein